MVEQHKPSAFHENACTWHMCRKARQKRRITFVTWRNIHPMHQTSSWVVLTALTASFTGLFGLHEATQTVEAMKDGVSKSLEVLAEMGGKVQEAALRAGYGPTIRADSVKQLVESVVSWQTKSYEIIEEMRTQSTRNANEIRDAVEDGKRKLARLAEQGKGLELTLKS